MKQRTPSQRRLLLAAIAGLTLLLAALIWQGVRRGDPVRVGIPKSAEAYGAAMLLQTPSAQYRCTLGSTPEALATALREGQLDAALLPLTIARTLDDCDIRAVVGFVPLAVLTREEEITGWNALDGRTLTLPEALRGSRAEAMLRQTLRESKLRCEIAFGDSGDPRACGPDAAAPLLAGDTGWRVLGVVSAQWRKALPSTPPAGLCLVVRRDYLARAGSDFAAFERALESSLRFSGEKRKKTAAMAAAAGLAESEEMADALYPLNEYVWLAGDDMRQSLYALP